jgi:hypothetical protein
VEGASLLPVAARLAVGPRRADICEKSRRSLKFDLVKAEFVGDPEANRLRNRAMRAPYTF